MIHQSSWLKTQLSSAIHIGRSYISRPERMQTYSTVNEEE